MTSVGGTTKDGKKSMMFPDETLYAREQIYEDQLKSLKSGERISEQKAMSLLNLQTKVWESSRKMSDPAHKKQAEELIVKFSRLLGGYREKDLVDYDTTSHLRKEKPERV